MGQVPCSTLPSLSTIRLFLQFRQNVVDVLATRGVGVAFSSQSSLASCSTLVRLLAQFVDLEVLVVVIVVVSVVIVTIVV